MKRILTLIVLGAALAASPTARAIDVCMSCVLEPFVVTADRIPSFDVTVYIDGSCDLTPTIESTSNSTFGIGCTGAGSTSANTSCFRIEEASDINQEGKRGVKYAITAPSGKTGLYVQIIQSELFFKDGTRIGVTFTEVARVVNGQFVTPTGLPVGSTVMDNNAWNYNTVRNPNLSPLTGSVTTISATFVEGSSTPDSTYAPPGPLFLANLEELVYTGDVLYSAEYGDWSLFVQGYNSDTIERGYTTTDEGTAMFKYVNSRNNACNQP